MISIVQCLKVSLSFGGGTAGGAAGPAPITGLCHASAAASYSASPASSSAADGEGKFGELTAFRHEDEAFRSCDAKSSLRNASV